MAVKWTEEQKQVISLRHRNLLVSAAAGSGKTAVLVERILALVTDPEHPVDIDRLLVVTFTRAAAGEMKDRIARALEKRLEERPEDLHLQRQGVLLQHAQISTIHGFCTFVLQNYFHRIDLDPAYRIAEEDDLLLLRARVLDDLLEEEYTAADETSVFPRFMRAYGGGRSDRRAAEMVRDVYLYAVSDPDPDAWLDRCLEAYVPRNEEELENCSWMRELIRETGYVLEGLLQSAVRLRDLVQMRPEAPQAYLPALQSDVALLSDLSGTRNYRVLQEMLSELKYEKLGAGKQAEEDPDLREAVKKARNGIKDQVDKLRKELFAVPPEQVLEDLAAVRPYAEELVRLVRRFRDAYSAAKRERNILDFSDLEHLALRILTEKKEDGSFVPSDVARELAGRFEEVMIDEYQDSNYLQEALLKSVSRQGGGRDDRFMVGDIKQSIYGFRQARPDIFLEKFNRYKLPGKSSEEPPEGHTAGEGTDVRIDLHKNFRSRPQVLDSVNALFSRLMIPQLGGIDYNEEAALYPGADYPDSPDPSFPETELLLVDRKAEIFEADSSRAAMVEVEARTAAARIRRYVQTEKLWDPAAGRWRPVRYRDCVILLRAAGTWGDTFVRVLQSEGIPAYTASKKGYFTTVEVAVVLDYLRICDNPRQDIPMAAVLRSAIGGMTDRELSAIRAACRQGSLYDALRQAAGQDEADTPSVIPEELRSRAGSFLRQLESFRERIPYTPVHSLIRQILEETGFGEYAAAMPAGAQRQANLEMLAERASAYEKTNYHGLFRFVRYIEQLKDRAVDFGEVSLYGEEEDIVRIMTIHKSKGLEFPIVFVAGIGNAFNKMDERAPALLHSRTGIGLAAVYLDQRRIRENTLFRAAVRNAVRRDALAEELRVLYVAMTRAKEKLVLIGTAQDKAGGALSVGGDVPGYQQLIHAGSYLDWILAAQNAGAGIRTEWVSGGDLVLEKAADLAGKDLKRQELLRIFADGEPGAFDAEAGALLAQIGTDSPDIPETRLPAKMTVSELKRREYQSEDEESEQGMQLYPEEPVVPYVPRFMQEAAQEQTGGSMTDAEGERLEGAARGTAYHRVFAALDYAIIQDRGASFTEEDVDEMLAGMEKRGILTGPERAAVRAEDVRTFLAGPLGMRMAQAACAGTLRREQPFVLDLPVSEIRRVPKQGEGSAAGTETEEDPEKTVLLQGTIDAYWEEDGAYVLADYKTDRVAAGEEAVLAERYRIQLEYYRIALERITGIPVKEMYIYAVAAGKEIPAAAEEGDHNE